MSKPTGDATKHAAATKPAVAIATPFDYIIDAILPAGEVHLFGGPSGSGKTTLLLQMIQTWRLGQLFFGHPCYPQPFVYVSCDRSRNGVLRTFRRTGTDPDSLPFFSAITEGLGSASIETIVSKSLVRYRDARVLFVEGLGSKVPNGKVNDYHTVARFLSSLTRTCETRGLTIIGVVHSAKTKKGEEYLNPRERALGSVAWAAYSETIVLVEPVSPDGSTDDRRIRKIQLLPRNAAEEVYEMEFVSGLLKTREKRASHDSRFAAWVGAMCPGDSFDIEEAQAQFPDVPRRTLNRWLNQEVTGGRLERSRKGIYCKPGSDLLDTPPISLLAQ